MKKINYSIVSIFLLYLLLFTNCLSYCQNKQSIEFTAQIRREKQADYTTRFGTVSYQNALQLYGTSIGFDIGYERILRGGWFIKPFTGYYRFVVNKIKNNRIPAAPYDPSDYRSINYRPDSTPLGYSTNKYHYNNILFGIAFGKAYYFNKTFSLSTDLSFSYLVTFSQFYKVGPGYTTKNGKALGYLVNYKVGLKKEFKNIYFASNILIPIYKEWKQDVVFLENPNVKLATWFGGCGVTFTVGKYFK